MKTILTILLSTFLFISCNKEKEQPKPATDTVPKDTIKEEVIPEEVPDVYVFTVQIGAFKNTNKTLADITNVNIYREDNLYKYRLGAFDSYREARKYRSQLRRSYPDAFVQALKNDTPLNIIEALQVMK